MIKYTYSFIASYAYSLPGSTSVLPKTDAWPFIFVYNYSARPVVEILNRRGARDVYRSARDQGCVSAFQSVFSGPAINLHLVSALRASRVSVPVFEIARSS